ncbi:uncharacterized protein LOC114520833 [Dendronephthya gigantea]|uniref:uncharacterized protein LOC114520833 n=1 Tax=Dendronephthya gigantea TaxID=151771 RepID=UPI0010695D36|nr:uncharacterized protein LOC114520833 [Dendronephthya gigantea]
MDTTSQSTSIVNTNCQNVVNIIGDNNVINLQGSEVQDNHINKVYHPGNVGQKHQKVACIYPDKPFHISRERTTELNQIESLFLGMTDVDDVVRTVYLTGLPGAGKTELARQYGKHVGMSTDPSKHTLVITLNAKSKESLLKSVEEATQSFSVQRTNHNLDVLMKKLGDHFRAFSGTWLLIIDDMFGKNDFNDLFPRPGSNDWGGGRILVTTQDNNLPQACSQFEKNMSLNGGMSKEDAVSLLKDISRVEFDGFAEEIINELKYLPLPLACCATYVGEIRQDRASTQFGWEEYLNRYRDTDNSDELQSRTFRSNNSAYPSSMMTATRMAVNRIAKASDVLKLAFSFLSYCSSSPVPLKVLALYVQENLPDRNNQQTSKGNEILEIENEISRCSLLIHERSRNVEAIKCHQVIHHALKWFENSKPDEQQENEFGQMMKCLNETLDNRNKENTDKEGVLLRLLLGPLLKLFVDHAILRSWNTTPEFVFISVKNDQFLFSTSGMPVEDAEKRLELLESVHVKLDIADKIRCEILSNLWFYYIELDLKKLALKNLREAYEMTDDESDKEWLYLRCCISFHLAQTYFGEDNFGLAEKFIKTSISMAKKIYAEEEDQVMERYFWLAKICYSLKKFWKLGWVVEEAKCFYSKFAPDIKSLKRARCLDFLSRIYNYKDGVEFFYIPIRYRNYIKLRRESIIEALDIYEQILGTDVASCSDYCVLLAECAKVQLETNPTEAKEKIEKALEYCNQNGDKFNMRVMAANKKHLFDNSSWWRRPFYDLKNFVSRGYIAFAADINVCDEVLEGFENGAISPSPRAIIPIRRKRKYLDWADWSLGCLLIIYCFICMLTSHLTKN